MSGGSRRLGVIYALVSLGPAVAFAEASRLDDIVAVRDGKFVSEEYSLCEVARPASMGQSPKFQMQTYSEAPAKGVISRDNFVAYTAGLLTLLQVEMVSRAGVSPSQALSALDCEEISSPIGTVDLKVRIVMTADGMQVEITDTSTGQVSRNTSPWQ